eukprot:EG_transcript_4937
MPLLALPALRAAVYAQERKSPVPPAEDDADAQVAIRSALLVLRHADTSGRGVATACGAVQDLLNTDDDRHTAVAADAVPLLAATVLRHGACPAVVLSGLAVLTELAALSIAQAQLLHRGALSCLLCALRQHLAHPGVMAAGVVLLAQLAHTQKGRLQLFDTQAVELVIEAMLSLPQDAEIQALGAELVRHLADGPIAQQRLLALGAAETLVEAVRGFPQDAEVQLQALAALCRLCEADQTRSLVGRVGGVAAVLRSLACHSGDLPIARRGCTLLGELALCAALQPQIATAPVRTLVRRVVRLHPRDTVLRTHGRVLLGRAGAGRASTKATVADMVSHLEDCTTPDQPEISPATPPEVLCGSPHSIRSLICGF